MTYLSNTTGVNIYHRCNLRNAVTVKTECHYLQNWNVNECFFTYKQQFPNLYYDLTVRLTIRGWSWVIHEDNTIIPSESSKGVKLSLSLRGPYASYADWPIVFWLRPFSFPNYRVPPAPLHPFRNFHGSCPVRILKTLACRGLFKSFFRCHSSLFFARAIARESHSVGLSRGHP